MAKDDMVESTFFAFSHYGKQTENQTMVIEIWLLGFQHFHIFKFPLCTLLVLNLFVTILGNALIITLVSTCKSLHSPMYFFLQHLSISDILLTINIIPNMLRIVINDGTTISLAGCITQCIFFSNSEAFECLLLTVMSYDRYLAICNPLRYAYLMDQQFCISLVAMCWFLGFTLTMSCAVTISMLHFCGQIIIDHFFCDPTPLLELSCSDTFFVQMEVFILADPVIILPFLFIIVTYVCIGFAIQKIKSNTGRQKAFSTCSSHLAVVGIFYGTLISMYSFPSKGQSQIIKKLLSLLYAVLTPLLNPIIYSMRSKDMKEALSKYIHKITSPKT